MKKEMLINVLQPEECRIAIVEDGVLEELYVERASQESYVGNIYKGRIVNIEASIQAAFVDFGIGRNGFLHVSDVDPAYYKHLLSKEDLAEYEAELDREYGRATGRGEPEERGGRGREGGTRQAQPLTSFLQPQSAAAKTPAPPDEELMEDFAAGLTDDAPASDDTPASEEVSASLNEETPGEESWPTDDSPAAASGELADEGDEDDREDDPDNPDNPDDEDGFATGIVDDLPPPRRANRPGTNLSTTPPPAREATPAETSGPADEDFGSGIVAPDPAANPASIVPSAPIVTAASAPPAPPAPPVEVEPRTPEPPLESESGPPQTSPDVPEASEGGDVAEPEAEPKKRTRPRRPKAKAEEPAAEAAESSESAAEAKGRPKPRRGRKKTEGESDTPDEAGTEDKPKYMGGAERHTTADDDEPEIRPFFEDGGGFDPDAPNDRFAPASDRPEPEGFANGYASDPETAEDAEEEAREVAQELEQLSGAGGPETEEAESGVGRGFNDDFEDRRASQSRDRDRGRGRGGRDRDRDRGSRGGSDRGGRGTSGFKAGPRGGRDRGLPKPPIEQIFKRGQEVIVQVIKEAVGTKGPTLSTYISIAGRYLVLMPSLNRVGVSRKIEDFEARRRLREIMATLNPPKGVGFIVRTAAIDRDARELRNDLAYLLRLWQVVVKRIKRVSGPIEIYRESDMITRTIRDIFTNDIDTIWVDEPNAFAHASEFLQIVMPRFASRIRYFESTEPLFHKYNIEDEISKIYQKRIEMPLGGSLIIEQTEALVAIDVNSGNFRADNNAEETAFQMNLLAAREIARQLRLRDLGGVIVNDFIDMKSEVHRRKVEDAFREALRRDRARTKILRISQFGLIEMTRQRIRPSLKRSLFTDCPYCKGNGFVKTSESLSIDVMRLLQLAAHRAPSIASVQVTVHADAAHYLLNKRRKDLAALEERGKMEIVIIGETGISPDVLNVRCYDHNGNEVRLVSPPPPPRLSGGKLPAGRGDRSGRGAERDRRYPQPLN